MESTLSVKQTLSKPQTTKLVLPLLGAEPAPTRNGRAKELCRQLDLRDSKGDWQMSTTAKALRGLAEQGLWKLPKPLFSGRRGWSPSRLERRVPKPNGGPEELQEVGGLWLREVLSEEHLRVRNELGCREHALQGCRL